MKRTNLTDLAVNVEANAFASLLDGGFIDIYDGEQPASADEPLNGQRRGVTLGLGKPAFGKSASGVIVANVISPGIAVASLQRATWARLYRADHKTAVMDVSVSTRDAVIILPTVNIPSGVTVTCSYFSHSVVKSTDG